MKTRILYTKIWEDDFVSTLPLTQKALFIYFITNQRIGQTGIYEVTDRIILFETGATKDQLEQAKEAFHKANKIHFINGWVKVINSQKYNSYTGENNEKARIKELEAIPEEIISTFDTPSEVYDTPSMVVDGTTNHNNKSEIINNKSNRGIVKGEFSDIMSLEESHMQEIADKYQVPLAFVISKYDDLVNWHGKNPRKNKYENYYRGLSDWVKRDALERRENATGKSKIAYVGDTL